MQPIQKISEALSAESSGNIDIALTSPAPLEKETKKAKDKEPQKDGVVKPATQNEPKPKGSLYFQLQQKQKAQKVLRVLQAFNQDKSTNKCAGKYKVPPIFFFVAHVNANVYELIANNFDYLKKLGYTRICFEHDNNQTLDEAIQCIEADIKTFEAEKAQYYTETLDAAGKKFFEEGQIVQDTVFKPLYKFLCAIKQSGFTYVGMDGPLKEFRNPEFVDVITTNSEIEAAREQCMLNNILAQAEASEGGTIVITGYGHAKLQEKMEAHIKESISHCLFFDFNPICDELFQTEEFLQEIAATQFKHKPLALDTTKGGSALNQQFQKHIAEQMAKLAALEKPLTQKRDSL